MTACLYLKVPLCKSCFIDETLDINFKVFVGDYCLKCLNKLKVRVFML